MGDLPSKSNAELEEEREALRLEYVATQDIGESDRLYHVLHEYDVETINRANEAYARENPNPPPTRHREHGWYLPNDD